MNQVQFKIQMDRMIQTFGKTPYCEERMNLIWKEVRDFDIKWFEYLCSRFIGENRQAPIVPEFREACIDEREKLLTLDRELRRRDAKEAMTRFFSDDDQAVLFKGLNDRIKGEMDDVGFKHMINNLDRITSFGMPAYGCAKCNDTGVAEFFDGRFSNRILCVCVSEGQHQKAADQNAKVARH